MIPPTHNRLTRRGFCLCCTGATIFAATGGWLTPREAYAQAKGIVGVIRAAAERDPIKLHHLRGNVSVLEGSGGNVAVLPGSDGKVLIDAGISASRSRIVEAMSTLGPEPIRHLINTHWHFDHTDGNEWLKMEGANILAHENTIKHLRSAQRVEDWDFNFPPSPPAALPTESMSAEKSLRLNNSTLLLKHQRDAHTDGDITVAFAEADIFHTGDIYWNGIYPFIDYSTGGSIDGTIRAVDAILETISAETIVVPGHGQPVSNKTELKDYREMLASIRSNVAELKKQGRSLDEAIAARPTATFDAKWGQFVIDPAFFAKLVYEGV
ncbi:MBL fold metallo-hydrolase (plasmid) [Microvirga terrae]|uniref:MBL fold metallo-hydrolase n=1 Tax=Microvirga terrae TaxID=2740529 RepID=A0ABY5RY36_9HYPH|nr:MBL fold metallo-hydrolase [Microvirga terrae]UVF22200.1 MBL fold metallo-hydrolase [Microvirga terrae]